MNKTHPSHGTQHLVIDFHPGRDETMPITDRHYVTGVPLKKQPDGFEVAFFGMGCFWGAERAFWALPGVYSTAVGYAGGVTRNPTYQEVCSGRTGHAEVVRVIYDTNRISFAALLKFFWENHDPTQGMQQGEDRGTQYRSALYCTTDKQLERALQSRAHYETSLQQRGYPSITTEITKANLFYFAEDYHQQYLAKNPGGYCGLGGTGISCSVELNALT